MTLPFTIQVPVFDETRALEFSCFYFERLGVEARYILDSQRTPQAEATLRGLGRGPLVFANDKPFLENAYQNFAAASPTDRILRLDCDEAPSQNLVEACREIVLRDGGEMAGFERHQLIWRHGEFLSAQGERFRPSNQVQWRLFNRRAVRFYDGRLHTPGLFVDKPVKVPADAPIYHLEWVFLDRQARLDKTSRYDGFGQDAYWRENQLHAEHALAWRRNDDDFLRATFADWIAGGGKPAA